MNNTMTQEATYPHDLHDLVARVKYKAGWFFDLGYLDRGQGSRGLTLTIKVFGPDSYDASRDRGVLHYMIVPAAGYDARAWVRWLLDQIILVETHEACEFFRVDDKRPFSPNHGPGRNPYSILEKGTAEDAKTRSV